MGREWDANYYSPMSASTCGSIGGFWSPWFAKTVAWKLAAMIALPLTGKQKLAERAEIMAQVSLDDAIAHDFNRDQEPEPPDADWIEARGANPSEPRTGV